MDSVLVAIKFVYYKYNILCRKAFVEASLCFYKQNAMWTVVWTVVWTVCGLCVDCVLTVVDWAGSRPWAPR